MIQREQMKDSGIKWIGKIPDSWQIIRIKDISSLKSGGTPEGNEGIVFDEEDNIRWYTAPDFNETTFELNKSERSITQKAVKENSYKQFPKESTLIVSIASLGKIGITKVDCYSNQQITAIIPDKSSIYPKYLTYSLIAGVDYIKETALYTTIPIINSQFIGGIKISFPDKNEQQKISDFLDKKCAEIDEIIAEKENQVSIIENYKKTLITETIITGKNATAKLVNKNIKWLNKVSSEANILRLKNYSYMKGRIGWQGLTSDEFIDEGPYCVTGTDFKGGHIDWTTSYHISEKRYQMDYNIQLKVGDLLVTKDGTIGKLARVNFLPDKACLNSHLLIIRPIRNKFINDYLYYVMLSDIFIRYYNYESSGSTMDSLSQEKLGNFTFPVYSISKQKEIATFLDKKCEKIDKIITEQKESVEKLKAYKKSLIYEYVTGKKRV